MSADAAASADIPAEVHRNMSSENVGARLRAARKAAGLTVADLAERWRDVAPQRVRQRLPALKDLERTIRGHEAGEHAPGPRYRPLWARALNVAEAELFDHGGEPAPVAWRSDGLAGQLTREDEERLVLAAARPARTDTAVVGSLGTILAAQRRVEDAVGAAPLIAPVRAQLATIEGMVVDARGPVRAQLLDVAGQWAQFAGWLHTSVGRPGEALTYLGRTLQWASEIDDRHLVGSVMSWQGYIAERRGELGSMIGLSQAGQRVRRGTPDRVTALYQEARARARLGEANEVHRLTEAAAAEAAEAAPARPWEYYYDRNGIFGLEHGLIYRILGRTDPSYNARAVEHLTAGLDVLSEDMRSSEWAGAFLFQLALAYRQDGEHGEAARVVQELEEITARLGSVPLRRRLEELR